jgi:hypothetical protein
VVSRLYPSLKSYKATFTVLYGPLNELLAQLLELAARWSPNYSIESSGAIFVAPTPLRGELSKVTATATQGAKGYVF